jgi:hypothetical protein
VLELCVGEGEDTECGVAGVFWYNKQREGRGGERQRVRCHVLKVLELCVGEGEDTECGVFWYIKQREGRGGERQECGATSSGMCSRLDSCAFV